MIKTGDSASQSVVVSASNKKAGNSATQTVVVSATSNRKTGDSATQTIVVSAAAVTARPLFALKSARLVMFSDGTTTPYVNSHD